MGGKEGEIFGRQENSRTCLSFLEKVIDKRISFLDCGDVNRTLALGNEGGEMGISGVFDLSIGIQKFFVKLLFFLEEGPFPECQPGSPRSIELWEQFDN